MAAYSTVEAEWYKVIGNLQKSLASPIIAPHGGPGADDTFWTFDLFIAELENLVDHLQLRQKGFYVLGQSWGGMLAGMYASRRPEGLKKLVISGSPASFPLFIEGGKRLRAQLPSFIRKALEGGDRDGNYNTPEYEQASAIFYARHVCRIDPLLEAVQQAFDGSEEAKNINVDTLFPNRRYDEVTKLCVEPWFKSIPKIKWVVFENSSYMPHWEERERFIKLVRTFLTTY
ncbi:Alpha/Beta hydrolase protein [Biscogniauxia marginata]|nr:Alpha/Beta hydrolase protein [Biscogniauxia marginata]